MRHLLILAVLAAPHATVDRTLSCPVVQEGQALVVNVQGSVPTPRTGAYLKFWPTPLAFDEPAVLPGVEIDTRPRKIVWDPRGRCEPAAKIPFVRRGLKQDVVVTSHFVGYTSVTCRAAPRIRFRARITATHAEVVVVADNAARPILYVDWTPARIAVWDRGGCES